MLLAVGARVACLEAAGGQFSDAAEPLSGATCVSSASVFFGVRIWHANWHGVIGVVLQLADRVRHGPSFRLRDPSMACQIRARNYVRNRARLAP